MSTVTNTFGLAGDFIKKHLEIEKNLENRIIELEEEIKRMQNNNEEDPDYSLYKNILKLIIPNISFSYDTEGGYNMSVETIKLPLDYIDELIKEVKKYKALNNDIYI